MVKIVFTHPKARQTGKGYEVGQSFFLVGILCSLEESRLDRQLRLLGVKARQFKRACLMSSERAGLKGLHHVCNYTCSAT